MKKWFVVLDNESGNAIHHVQYCEEEDFGEYECKWEKPNFTVAREAAIALNLTQIKDMREQNVSLRKQRATDYV